METINIYVLECSEGKYYIGKARDVNKRYQEHLNGNGSEWTKLYPPIRLLESWSNKSKFDEDSYTLKYMELYGINNVRGGSYSQVNLNPAQIDYIRRQLNAVNDRCYKCGGPHFAKDCVTIKCYGCGGPHYIRNCPDKEKKEVEKKEETWGSWSKRVIFNLLDVNLKTTKLNPTGGKPIENKEDKPIEKQLCVRCGRNNHTTAGCYAKTDIKGQSLN